MDQKKLFVFDMDGTLCNSKRNISNANIEAIKKAYSKGHKIAIATGRHIKFAKDTLMPIWDNIHWFIGCNGSTTQRIAQSEIYHIDKTLDRIIIPYLLEVINKKGGGLQVLTSQKVFTYTNIISKNSRDLFTLEDKYNFYDAHTPISEMKEDDFQQIVQLGIHVEKDYVFEFKKDLENLFGDKYTFLITSENNIDVVVKSISKLFGIKFISKKDNINFENVYVFGDSENDIEGLNFFKNSFAMMNAMPHVKQIASKIIGNNDSNAIAHEILKNI